MTLLPVILPQGAVLKVSVGDKLIAGDVLAQVKSSGKEYIIRLSADFGIPLKNIKTSLKKNLGDGVEAGDVVAVKKEAFGLTSVEIISQFSGTLVKIDEDTGDVCIKSSVDTATEPVISPVEGIVDFCDNEKIVIKTQKEAILAEDALGEEAQGRISYIEHFDPEKLINNVSDKILLLKNLDKASLFKIIGLDGGGVITQEISDADFTDFAQKKLKMPVMNVTEEDFKKLVGKNGEEAYLNGENKTIIIL